MGGMNIQLYQLLGGGIGVSGRYYMYTLCIGYVICIPSTSYVYSSMCTYVYYV